MNFFLDIWRGIWVI